MIENIYRRVTRLAAGAAFGCLIVAVPLAVRSEPAQWAPQRDVEFIVPTAAGSTMDVLARSIQKIWQEQHAVNVPIVVEAKSGAGGAVAWTYLSRKPATATRSRSAARLCWPTTFSTSAL